MTERIAYEFDRYLYGSKMAEGVTVRQADSFEEATVVAARLCGGQRGTVLVPRFDTLMLLFTKRVGPYAAVKPKKGDQWMHPITGTVYVFDGENYVSTSEKPYGTDPMGVLS